MYRLILLILVVLISGPVLSAARLSQEESRQWTRYLVPLPKSIEIQSKVVLAPKDISVQVLNNSELVQQAVKELREALQIKDQPQKARFTILFQLGGHEAEVLLGKLRNSSQAYAILPGKSGDSLTLTAVSPQGLYYASKTLQQLVRAGSATGKIQIPVLKVIDWPDLESRGLWGSDSHMHLKWLAERKINLVSQLTAIGVDEKGRGYGDVKPGREMLKTEAHLYGIEHAPAILHLEQIAGKGVTAAYPQLAAEDAPGVICYSKPEIVDILADWMVALSRLPHVRTVDLWFTENLAGKSGCQCKNCKKENRDLLEARVVVRAWQKARQSVPNLSLRVLTSEETYSSNKLIFKELPPEIKVWFYHSLLTYNTGETPIIPREIQATARSGRWVGAVPSLGSSVRYGHPFTCAPFIRYRLNEFVDKSLSGLLGYATPGVMPVGYNVEAMAEWSWNAKSRSTREFAVSYAVRQGIKDPEKFAEWAETSAPVAWDVYGSEWPACEMRKQPGPAAEALRKGKLPELGTAAGFFRGPWADLKSPEQLEKDVADAAKAVELAYELDQPEFVQESLIVQGYIQSLQALYHLKTLVKNSRVTDFPAAKAAFHRYSDSIRQAQTALLKWYSLTSPESKPLTDKTIAFLEGNRKLMKEYAVELGCW